MVASLELRSSKMKLRMDLLHEMDLLNFLDDLKKEEFYTLRGCAIKRLAAEAGNPQSPRLSAECSLYWLTMGERGGSAGEAPKPAAR